MNESNIVFLLHLTARITFVFFFCAFTGDALRDLWPVRVSQWLARSHDYLLVAQAVSHTVHLGAIIAYFQLVGWSRLKMPTLLGGGFIYLLIYALAATALVRLFSNRQALLIGSVRFEGFALYFIWLVFALAFVPRIVSGWPVYSLFGFAAIAAFTIRFVCKLRHNKAMTAAA